MGPIPAPVPIPYLKEHAVEFVAQRILAPWDERPLWAMVLGGKVVGGIGIKINVEQATGALGYSIANKHWRRGLIVEAARAVVDWGFRKCRLAKVYACADGGTRSL